MIRADYIKNSAKLSLIALATIVFILCLSFTNADGMTNSMLYLNQPSLSALDYAHGYTSGNYQATPPSQQFNSGLSGLDGSNYYNIDTYRPFNGNDMGDNESSSPTCVPEPTTLLLLGLGLTGAGLLRRRG